jgi:hypothetical protein
LGDGTEHTFGAQAAPRHRPHCSGQRLLIEASYDAPLELDEPELDPMLGQFPPCGVVLGAVVLGVVVLGVVVVELPLAAQAAPPAPSAAAATMGAM